MSTFQQTKQIIKVGLASVLLAFVAASPAFAATYGCGTYGANTYNGNCPPSSAPTSSSTPSSTTTTSQAAAEGTILLNDFAEFTTTAGKTLDLKVNQVVYFNITVNGVVEEHKATIIEVGADYVIIVFDSSSTQVRINVGQTIQQDVTGDNNPDIEVTLNSITNGLANLTFKQLAQTAPASSNNSAAETRPDTAKGSSFWKIAAIVFSIFLILLAILWAILTWRKRHTRFDQY